jgi:hypothetical protein
MRGPTFVTGIHRRKFLKFLRPVNYYTALDFFFKSFLVIFIPYLQISMANPAPTRARIVLRLRRGAGSHKDFAPLPRIISGNAKKLSVYFSCL